MDNYINCLINLKLNALKRDYLDSLTYKQLRRVLYETKWLLAVPTSLSEIAKDIDSLTIEEITKYLTVNDQEIQKSVQNISQEFEQGITVETESE